MYVGSSRSGLRPRVVRWTDKGRPSAEEVGLWLKARYGAKSALVYSAGRGFPSVTHFSYD